MNKVQQAIDFAKQNPDSEYATELRKRIESGAMDKELSEAGLNQYVKNPQPVESTLGDKIKNAFKESSVFGGGEGIVNVVDGQLVGSKEKAQEAVEAGLGFVGGAGGEIKNRVVSGVKNILPKIESKVEPMIDDVASLGDEISQVGSKLKNQLQVNIAKGNVSPQLETSAKRLVEKDPVGTYEKYLTQSKKSVSDIKMDKPIETVGGKIGDAFETVIKKRSAVGKTLGEELKTVGNTKINILESKNNLLSELSDSGLSFNPKTKQLTSFQGSKFAPEEVAMLDDFTKGLNALGDSPTLKQIDNFISKTRANLTFTKGKSGVMGTTNAERIIKGGIAKLRDSIDPAVNGNKSLSRYWEANKTYAELSDFIEEGSSFLGKKTLSGDFAKDASVAKSSVQSILNSGKKDFLLQLEKLTGYKALDESVLALQAMADAGLYQGKSLLQVIQDMGGVPSSKAGFTQKILDMAISKGEKLIAGTPEEQTRALLKELQKNAPKK